MAGLIMLWAVAMIVTAFFFGRSSAIQTPEALTVMGALDTLVDEGLLTLEDRETLWWLYASKARAV